MTSLVCLMKVTQYISKHPADTCSKYTKRLAFNFSSPRIHTLAENLSDVKFDKNLSADISTVSDIQTTN